MDNRYGTDILCSASFIIFGDLSVHSKFRNVRMVNAIALLYTEPVKIPVNGLHFTCNSNDGLRWEMVKLLEEVSDVASEFEVQVQLNNALQF